MVSKLVKKANKQIFKIVKYKQRICKKKVLEEHGKFNFPTIQMLINLLKNGLIIAHEENIFEEILLMNRVEEKNIGHAQKVARRRSTHHNK